MTSKRRELAPWVKQAMKLADLVDQAAKESWIFRAALAEGNGSRHDWPIKETT